MSLMSGFDIAGIDREFIAVTEVKSSFICSNLVNGDPSGLLAQSPRFAFDVMAKII